MDQYLPLIFLSFLSAFMATPLLGKVANRTGFVDQPKPHKMHLTPIPLLGGLAIYLALGVALIRVDMTSALGEVVAVAAGATLLMLVGLWDDRRGLKPRVKLMAQLAAGFVVVVSGVQVQLFPWPVLNILITLFWIVGITNAINLMDNMDGLAAGISAVAALFFALMASAAQQGLVASLSAAVAGASLGFLYYNISPAVVFMGDTGSLLLGFLLAVLGLKYSPRELPLGSTWMVPIVVLGLPIFDTALVTFARLRAHRPVSQGGTDHTSHRLSRLGLGSSRAVLSMYLVAGALGSIAVWMTQSAPETAALVFIAVLLTGFAGVLLLERARPLPPANPPVMIFGEEEQACAAIRAAREVTRNILVVVSPKCELPILRRYLQELALTPEAFSNWLAAGDGQMLGPMDQWHLIFRLSGRLISSAELESTDVLRLTFQEAGAVLLCRGAGWTGSASALSVEYKQKCLAAPDSPWMGIRMPPRKKWDNPLLLKKILEDTLMGFSGKDWSS